MSIELIVTIVGLGVAGLAAILGIWMERDKNKPPRYAWALSVLILMATSVGMFQSYQDAKQGEKMEADMARMLQMLDKIANTSDVEVPELADFVKTEVSAQSRANPRVVQKMAQRVADEGEDPGEVLGSYLPASEVQGLQRKGTLAVKPPAKPVPSAHAAVAPAAGSGDPAAPGAAKPRRRVVFGVKLPAPTSAPVVALGGDKDKAEPKDADKDKDKDPKDAANAKDAPDGGAPKGDAADSATPRSKPAPSGKPDAKPAPALPKGKLGVKK